MFSEVFENRLVEWRSVRDSLETCNNPLQQVIEVYKKAPRIHNKDIDLWDQSTWLDPWQLINENGYTETCVLCGICYTLQLTERFSQSKFEIINSTNIETGETFQYLKVDNMVLQPMEGVVKNISECPSTWISQRIYDMQKPH